MRLGAVAEHEVWGLARDHGGEESMCHLVGEGEPCPENAPDLFVVRLGATELLGRGLVASEARRRRAW